jgi:hypothetical protein
VRTETLNVEEYRIRATRLLKALRAADPEAVSRFRALPEWSERSADEIRKGVRRKHALAVVAKEAGQRDWPQLKAALTASPEPNFDTTLLFQRSAGSLNQWFRSYREAAEVMTGDPPKFLFPYRHQFVVCERGLLEVLGIDLTDPDWERIGRDWAKPRDGQAKARLAVRLRRLLA